MAEKTREWVIGAEDEPRGAVPLLVGLMGPSGGGKTKSALRLATGMQEVTGGDIYGIDTENRRMKHYADEFKFKHVPFEAPFSSDAYLEVLRLVVSKGAKTVIVDSTSHEHAGEGGYLDFHDQELNRLVPDGNQRDRDKRNMQAWIRPSQARQRLINGMLQLDANFIFTFRAKETVKPDGGGKVIELGFMPIAGDAFLYEMTTCCLLMPVAGGVPTWTSRLPGERMMIKPAGQFAALFRDVDQNTPLSEVHGRGLAKWARGEDIGGQKALMPSKPAAQLKQEIADSVGSGEWDYAAWAETFQATLVALSSLMEFDAIWNDESNRGLIADLAEADIDRARALRAAASGRRKALKSLEPEKIGEM